MKIRFPGIILRVLRLEVSIYCTIFTYKRVSNHIRSRGGGAGVKSLVEVNGNSNLRTFVPITFKNSASGHPYSGLDHATLGKQISCKSAHTRPDHFYYTQFKPLTQGGSVQNSQTKKLFIFARGNSFSRPGIFMHSQAAEYVCFRDSWTVTLTKTNNTFGQNPRRFSYCSI
jgi:hypothetical protein